jgi:hypothetical protein
MEALEDRTVPSGDPGAMGPLAVTTQEYNFGFTAFHPPTPFPGNGVELVAEVKAPTTLTGQMPLIVLLHGQHFTSFNSATGQPDDFPPWPPLPGHFVIPSYHGYDYLGDVLASNGYIVVSISANGVNAHANDRTVPDGGAQARAELIQRHLDIWSDLNTGSGTVSAAHTGGAAQAVFGTRFVGHVDLHDIGLMGHSRGGQGVVKAFQNNQSLGSPYGIKAVFALAPTDVNGGAINNVPFAVLLPYNDGDLKDLQGAHYFDDSRYNVGGDSGAKYTIEVMGANHNFFNTVWSPSGGFPGGVDEGNSGPPSRLSEAQQRGAGVAYMSAFFQTYLGPTQQFLSVLDSDVPPPPSASVTADRIHTSYLPPDSPALRRDINRLNDPSNITTNTLGGAVTTGGLLTFSIIDGPPVLTPIGPYPNRGKELSLLYTGTAAHFFQNDLPAGARDERGYSDLQFRVGVDHNSTFNPGDQDFSVQLTDGTGHVSSVLVSAFSNDLFKPPFDPTDPNGRPHTVLNTVRIPLSAFATAGIDLSDLRSVRFNFDQRNFGALFLGDLAFSADVAGVQMSPVNNNLVIQNDPAAPANVQVVNATTSAVLGEFVISSLHSIAVACDNSTDTLTVSYQFGDPLPGGGLHYQEGAGVDTLNVNDQFTTTNQTFTMGSNSVQRSGSAVISYSGGINFVNVTGGSGNNTYNVGNTEVFYATTVNTGSGNDTVNVQATTGPLTVNAGGSGNDVVNVGNGGSLAGINGTLTLNNGPNWSHVNINDGADNATHPNVQLTATALTGLAPVAINFEQNSLNGLAITVGDGNNTYTVVNTAFSGFTGGNPTVLNTGNGNDTVNVQATTTTAPLTVNGGGTGADVVNVGNANSVAGLQAPLTLNNDPDWWHVNVNDLADNVTHPNVQLTGTALTGLAADINFEQNSLNGLTITVGNGNNNWTVANTAFSGFIGGNPTVLNTGNGTDTVFVQATTTTAPLTVNGGGSGNDVVSVGRAASLDGLQAPLTLNNGPSWWHVNVNDGADNATHPNVQLTATALTGLAADINFGPNSLNGLIVNGSSGNNTYTVVTTPFSSVQGGNPTLLNTGNGNDTVNVQATVFFAPLTVNTGTGANVVNVGSAANTLDPIQAAVTVTGGMGGFTTLNINDQGSTTPHSYPQTATSLSRSGAATISFFNIGSLHINKGPVAGLAPAAQDLALTDTVQVGDLATLSGQLVTDNPDAQLTLEVDWGDGSDPDELQPGLDPFSVQHSYDTPGTYTVRGIWSDLATGEANFQELTIVVLPA